MHLSLFLTWWSLFKFRWAVKCRPCSIWKETLYVPCVGEGKLKVDQKWHIRPMSVMPGGRQQIIFTFLDIIKTCGRHRKWKGPNILHHSLVGVCPLFVNWKCFNLLLVQKPVFFILTPPLTSYVVFRSNTNNYKTVKNTLSVICPRRKSELGVGSNLQLLLEQSLKDDFNIYTFCINIISYVTG